MIGRSLLAACLFAASNAFAADLLEVFRVAQTSDATYAAARSIWTAAQERIPQARSGLLPLVSLTTSAQHNERETRFRSSSIPRTSGNFQSHALTLAVTQPLFRPQSIVTLHQAMTQAEQADAQLALAAQDLALRVSEAYFAVLLARDTVAFAEAQKAAIAQQLEQARRSFEVGTTTITDTHEAQARYDLTVSQEIVARNELALRQRALETIVGRRLGPIAPLGPSFVLKPPEPGRLDPWVGLARQSNLQVKIAESARTFAAQEVERNRAARLPTIDAFATTGGTRQGAVGTSPATDARSAVIGVQFTLPIYQGGLVSSRVREALANETRALEDLENARRTAEFAAEQAYLGITNGIAQVRALEAARVSTESQVSSTRLGLQVGVRTQVDVLNAQQLLFSARRDLAQAKYTYLLSLLRLEAAIGELTETDIEAVNRWLERAKP